MPATSASVIVDGRVLSALSPVLSAEREPYSTLELAAPDVRKYDAPEIALSA